MKKVLKRLGFHKMDEMEQYIIFRAQRNAYLFLIAALIFWTLYESYNVYVYHSRLNLFPSLLLSVSILIQIFSQLLMTRNAVKDDEDSFERGPLVKIIILICKVAGIIAIITAAIVILGVKI